jgi:hypothetical protein
MASVGQGWEREIKGCFSAFLLLRAEIGEVWWWWEGKGEGCSASFYLPTYLLQHFIIPGWKDGMMERGYSEGENVFNMATNEKSVSQSLFMIPGLEGVGSEKNIPDLNF